MATAVLLLGLAPAPGRATLLRRGNATSQRLAAEVAGGRNTASQGYGGAAGAGAAPGEGCHPKCWWSCGSAECDETCDPVCAPPQCETACAAINAATCRHKCEPPKCAIVCPSMHCDHGDCPQCKAVCNPPKCETVCAESCESNCAEPQCSWKCKPGKCEKPKCNLVCGGAKACNFKEDLNTRPDFQTGMRTISAGLASFDPATLGEPAGPAAGAAPAPA